MSDLTLEFPPPPPPPPPRAKSLQVVALARCGRRRWRHRSAVVGDSELGRHPSDLVKKDKG